MKMTKRPRITIMGEEVEWDSISETSTAAELGDYFKPVRLSPRAVDEASKIVPQEYWIKDGIYSWLAGRANYVFQKLPASHTVGRHGALKYTFEFDSAGPFLKSVDMGGTPI